jgi:hypothetical protein
MLPMPCPAQNVVHASVKASSSRYRPRIENVYNRSHAHCVPKTHKPNPESIHSHGTSPSPARLPPPSALTAVEFVLGTSWAGGRIPAGDKVFVHAIECGHVCVGQFERGRIDHCGILHHALGRRGFRYGNPAAAAIGQARYEEEKKKKHKTYA